MLTWCRILFSLSQSSREKQSLSWLKVKSWLIGLNMDDGRKLNVLRNEHRIDSRKCIYYNVITFNISEHVIHDTFRLSYSMHQHNIGCIQEINNICIAAEKCIEVMKSEIKCHFPIYSTVLSSYKYFPRLTHSGFMHCINIKITTYNFSPRCITQKWNSFIHISIC